MLVEDFLVVVEKMQMDDEFEENLLAVVAKLLVRRLAVVEKLMLWKKLVAVLVLLVAHFILMLNEKWFRLEVSRHTLLHLMQIHQ